MLVDKEKIKMESEGHIADHYFQMCSNVLSNEFYLKAKNKTT